MSTASGTRRAPRRQSQDGSADKVVVIIEATSPVVGSRRGPPTPVPGAQNSPIDVEAIEDEVQAVSPSRVPPPRRDRRTRREPITVVDLEVDASQEGNKRQRVVAVDHLSPDWGAGSSLQPNGVQTGKEPAKEVPKEPSFTCPICWNKMEEPSTTTCGHIFCDTCIKQAIKVQKKCPTCRKGLKMNSVHRIFLPNASS
ncbi:hypothetical protein Zm00014a_018826 [Zea mays]|nr:ubiquitin-protein ligase/ zinc ion binding protein [Zea mays]XP_020396121.1 ubiquitin-protein ligase/ zinc ion binding protein isoform X1 [Zea mays]ACG33759.1 ubiquitin-protein ligase/ zinc ion binding protein [Zea mays]ACN31466.1 unknown [Zea mays]ONM56185.1 RING/U-box superfamily protein [Zea mays]ONM56189.1 RING/U-box superfamily protein [Zea mays]PWZ15535.1 E3 ubiquitin-protein ligase RFWD2 [Zea mays]|eukprot:NP_001148999.1 ubiquitin-protein ligase/ zinc ion binding protein [Zea mays]